MLQSESVLATTSEFVSTNKLTEKELNRCPICGEPRCSLAKSVRKKGFYIKLKIPCTCEKEAQEEQLRREREETRKLHRAMHVQHLYCDSNLSQYQRKMTFSSFEVTSDNHENLHKAKIYCKNFARMLEENQGLLFYGGVGTGKSYLACCIANNLINNETDVMFMSFVDIVNIACSFKNNAEKDKLLDKILKTSLLILDDLGAERNTGFSVEAVYNVIESRIQANKPMIITTNLNLQDSLLNEKDPNVKTYNRILGNCYPMVFTGQCFRLVNAEKRYDRMEKLFLQESDYDVQ